MERDDGIHVNILYLEKKLEERRRWCDLKFFSPINMTASCRLIF